MTTVQLPLRYSVALIKYNLALILRSRLIVLLLAFGVGVVGLSMILTYLTPGTERRTFFNAAYLGLEALAILTPLLGSMVLQILEFDQQTIWLVLVRPPSRPAYLWGRFWGLVFASWCVLAAVALLVAALAYVSKALPEPFLLPVIYAAFLETFVITALACLVAFITSSYLTSVVIMLGVTILGYLSGMVPALADKVAWVALKPVLWLLYYVLPHLSDYAVRDLAQAPERWELEWLAGYTLLYAGAVLLLSMGVFSRREV